MGAARVGALGEGLANLQANQDGHGKDVCNMARVSHRTPWHRHGSAGRNGQPLVDVSRSSSTLSVTMVDPPPKQAAAGGAPEIAAAAAHLRGPTSGRMSG